MLFFILFEICVQFNDDVLNEKNLLGSKLSLFNDNYKNLRKIVSFPNYLYIDSNTVLII